MDSSATLRHLSGIVKEGCIQNLQRQQLAGLTKPVCLCITGSLFFTCCPQMSTKADSTRRALYMQAAKQEKGGGLAGTEAEPCWASARTENALNRDFTVNAIMCVARALPPVCLTCHRS